MKIRTTRRHYNAYAPQFEKNPGRIYDAPEKVARNLISAGYAEVYEREPEPDAPEVSD